MNANSGADLVSIWGLGVGHSVDFRCHMQNVYKCKGAEEFRTGCKNPPAACEKGG